MRDIVPTEFVKESANSFLGKTEETIQRSEFQGLGGDLEFMAIDLDHYYLDGFKLPKSLPVNRRVEHDIVRVFGVTK